MAGMDSIDTIDTAALVRLSGFRWAEEPTVHNYRNEDMTKYDVLDKMVRQGDIILYPIEELQKYAQLKYSPVLAFGEKSGHKHLVRGQVQVYETLEPEPIRLLSMAKVLAKKFVKVLETSMLQPTLLVHENKQGEKADHQSKKVKPGLYAVLTEQEYSPFEEEIKPVLD